jgi:hypothetical protein
MPKVRPADVHNESAVPVTSEEVHGEPKWVQKVREFAQRYNLWITPLPPLANTAPQEIERSSLASSNCRFYCYDNPMIKSIVTDQCANNHRAQLKDTMVLELIGYYYIACKSHGQEEAAGNSKQCWSRFYFTDTAPQSKPLVVELGQGMLVRGVDGSLVGMCSGDVRQLRIPAGPLSLGPTHGDSVPPDKVSFWQVTALQVIPTHQPGYNLAREIAKCAEGTVFLYSSGHCSACPAGKHQPLTGQTACYDCPSGAKARNSTLGC